MIESRFLTPSRWSLLKDQNQSLHTQTMSSPSAALSLVIKLCRSVMLKTKPGVWRWVWIYLQQKLNFERICTLFTFSCKHQCDVACANWVYYLQVCMIMCTCMNAALFLLAFSSFLTVFHFCTFSSHLDMITKC